MSTPQTDPRPMDERTPRPAAGPVVPVLALLLASAVAGAVLILSGPATIDDRDPRTLPPCAHEDGSGGPVPCYWDASEQGNRQGSDVVVWGTGPNDWTRLPAELTTP